MRRYLYALVPLLVLVLAISLACLLGYAIEYYFDPAWTLRKLIRKLSQLFLLLSIIPAMWYLRLGRNELGFAEKTLFFKQVWQGFLLGLITLFPVFVMLYCLGIQVVDVTQPWTWGWVGKKLVLELLLALLVSCFEEPVFRGILLAGLNRKMAVLPAVLITAFYYAILHFLDSNTNIPKQKMDVWSGFQLFGDAIGHLADPSILAALSSLLLVGVFLGLLRTQVPVSLGLCIGCHSSWVWQIKLNKTFFNADFNSSYAFLVSPYDGVIGPLITVWLAIPITVYLLSKYMGAYYHSGCEKSP